MKPATFGLFFLACGLFAQDQHVTWKLSRGARRPRLRAAKCCCAWRGTSKMAGTCIPCPRRRRFPPKSNWRPIPQSRKVRALQPQPKRAFDPNFNSDTETYEGDVAFLLELELKKDAPAGPAELAISARYQTCNPKMCVPSKWTGAATLTVDPAASPAAIVIPAGYSEPQAPRGVPIIAPRPRLPKDCSRFWPWPSASASPPSSRPASSP